MFSVSSFFVARVSVSRRRLLLAVAAAGVPLGVASPVHATDFGQEISYDQGSVPASLAGYNDGAAVGAEPQGITGEQFGFPGVVSPFNPPFDTDQIALVGVGGQMTVQFPHTLNVGSGPEIGVFSNAGLIDNDFPNGVASNPTGTFSGGTADFAVSEDGVKWFDVGTATIVNPENFYLNAGPYDTAPPADPQVADFGKPFTGTPASFSGEGYPQIVSTLNGSAGGTWLNLAGSGLSQVNYLRISEPAAAADGTFLAVEAISVANTLGAPATWSAGAGSWGAAANWPGGIIPQNAEDVAEFTAAGVPTTVTLDGNQTVGTIVFAAGKSYTIAPGSGGALILDNGALPATIQVSGSPTIAAAIQSAGAVNVTGGGTVHLGGGAALGGVLTIQPSATVDLGTQALSINYGSPDQEESAVQSTVAALSSAYSGASGRWTGTGLSSAEAAANPGVFALGYADGNADPGTPAEANEVLVMYTFAGDALLQGDVEFDDLVVLAQNFGLSGQDWAHGNFTYDPAGSVGFADLVLLAQNFGDSMSAGQSVSAAWRVGAIEATAVAPEPGAACVLALIPLAARRRRRRA